MARTKSDLPARGHTVEEWGEMVGHYGRVCVRCGSSGPLVRDHVIPVVRGGRDHISNLQPLCKRCNSAKNDSDTDYRPDQGAAFPAPADDPGDCSHLRARRARPKVIIAFSDEQEKWLRAEAARLDLPGGVNELVRRAVDEYREHGRRLREQARQAPTITCGQCGREAPLEGHGGNPPVPLCGDCF